MRATVATSNILVAELDKKIQLAKQKQLTGVLVIKSSFIHQWRLYFLAGHLVWANTRTHAKRRWFRHLSQHQPDLLKYGIIPSSEWTYGRLARLVICKKFNRTVFSNIVAGYIEEVLFDLQQQGTLIFRQTGQELTYRIKSQRAYHFPYVDLQNIRIWEQVRREWQAWEYAELTQVDPNDALEINDLAMLEDLASPRLVQLLNTLADGNHTLRDMALQANQALMPFVLSIFPHIRNQSLQLKSVGDTTTQIPLSQNNIVVKFPKTIIPKDDRIVYVDNNLTDSQTMATIIEAVGYRYSNIADPLEVLKKLVELQPKVVFLNLTMPVTNGYELCAQIRRLSGFKNTPIVMVGSSNNSMAERMRAKMVGVSEFVSKPIRPKTVLKTLIVLGII